MTHWLVQFSGVLENKNKKVGPTLGRVVTLSFLRLYRIFCLLSHPNSVGCPSTLLTHLAIVVKWVCNNQT